MNLSTPEHLAAIDHVLMSTRSVRKRLDLERPVEPEVIEKCLDLASQAPTGGNQQGWHFISNSRNCLITPLLRQSCEHKSRRK